MVIFTIACFNHLSRALQLARSARVSMPDSKIHLCLPERRTNLIPEISRYFDGISFVDELGYQNLDLFMFQHSIVEAATSIKARLFIHMLTLYPCEDLFLYFDPDIVVYKDLRDVISKMGCRSVYVTPHLLAGEIDEEKLGRLLFRVLNGGTFNAGFFGIQRSHESLQFLQWWDRKLTALCYSDISHGLFYDQKWIDFALGFMDLGIIRNVGFNVAWWNLPFRQIRKAGSELMVREATLYFVHFSGLLDPISKAQNLRNISADNHINILIKEYINCLNASPASDYDSIAWSYSKYESGEEISTAARVAVRRKNPLYSQLNDPFTSSNEEIVLWSRNT